MPEWLLWVEHFIQQTGFPIFIACVLLLMYFKQGKVIIEVMTQLKDAVDALRMQIGG